MSTKRWAQSGRISLWRYTESQRGYRGWHLNADRAGCASLLALLDALQSGSETLRTVRLSPPTQEQLWVPNNQQGRAATATPERLRLSLSDIPGEWRFPSDLEPASLVIGTDWLAPLRDGVEGIAQGRGDYAIGPHDRKALPLWFWW